MLQGTLGGGVERGESGGEESAATGGNQFAPDVQAEASRRAGVSNTPGRTPVGGQEGSQEGSQREGVLIEERKGRGKGRASEHVRGLRQRERHQLRREPSFLRAEASRKGAFERDFYHWLVCE